MQGESVMVGKCRENRPCRGIVTVIALLCSLVLSSPAGAVAVENLYKATVPVSGQGEAQLAEAYQAGLERVLVRVSGDRDVTRREGMETQLENAESLLASSQVGPGDNGDERLQLTFSARAVNRILAETGAAVWGMNRPLILAWIAVQDGGDRGLLVETGESSEQGWSALIRDRARDRGLPLALPPADRASDRTLLSEVWGQFMGQISRASSGMDHDLLAVVRIMRRDGGWQASWQYQGGGIEPSSGSVSADSQSALASALVDALTAELASRYAVTGGAINTGPYLRLAVEGVRSPSDYAAVKRALSQLNPVESVGAMTVSPDRIVFRMVHTGELAQLQQNIALDDRFRALASDDRDTSAQESDSSPILRYRWQSAAVAPAGAADQ
jgi:hypothetical protein